MTPEQTARIIELLERVEHPTPVDLSALAESLWMLATMMDDRAEPVSTADATRRCIDAWRALRDRWPHMGPELSIDQKLCSAHWFHSRLLAELGDVEGAAQAAGAAAAEAAELGGDPAVALALVNHAARLREAGLHEQAAEAAAEMIRRCDPPYERRHLGRALTEEVLHLIHRGRYDDASECSDIELSVWKHVDGGRSLELADALCNRAVIDNNLDRYAESMEVSAQSIELFRGRTRDGFESGLANAYYNRAVAEYQLGRFETALATVSECVKVFERLDAPQHAGELVEALQLTSRALVASGRPTDTLNHEARAVELGRALFESDPQRHRNTLRNALLDLSETLRIHGRLTEAHACAAEGLALTEPTDHDGSWPWWRVGDQLALSCADLGRPAEALELQEASHQHHEESGDEYDLAWSLQHRAKWIVEAGGSVREAVRMSTRAVELWQRVVEDNRDWLSDLADGLSDHANRLWSAGRSTEALDCNELAVGLWRELVSEHDVQDRPGLAATLADRARFLAHNGHTDEARNLSSQAIAMLEELVEELPTAHLPDLADALLDAADLGLTTQPESYRQRALAHYEQLATDEPEPYAAKLTALAKSGLDNNRRMDNPDREAINPATSTGNSPTGGPPA